MRRVVATLFLLVAVVAAQSPSVNALLSQHSRNTVTLLSLSAEVTTNPSMQILCGTPSLQFNKLASLLTATLTPNELRLVAQRPLQGEAAGVAFVASEVLWNFKEGRAQLVGVTTANSGLWGVVTKPALAAAQSFVEGKVNEAMAEKAIGRRGYTPFGDTNLKQNIADLLKPKPGPKANLPFSFCLELVPMQFTIRAVVKSNGFKLTPAPSVTVTVSAGEVVVQLIVHGNPTQLQSLVVKQISLVGIDVHVTHSLMGKFHVTSVTVSHGGKVSVGATATKKDGRAMPCVKDMVDYAAEVHAIDILRQYATVIPGVNLLAALGIK